MRNFKLFIDICDIYLHLSKIQTTRYTKPFMIIFIEAYDPDGACNSLIREIMKEIMKDSASIENRILCRIVRKKVRIERIESL